MWSMMHLEGVDHEYLSYLIFYIVGKWNEWRNRIDAMLAIDSILWSFYFQLLGLLGRLILVCIELLCSKFQKCLLGNLVERLDCQRNVSCDKYSCIFGTYGLGPINSWSSFLFSTTIPPPSASIMTASFPFFLDLLFLF